MKVEECYGCRVGVPMEHTCSDIERLLKALFAEGVQVTIADNSANVDGQFFATDMRGCTGYGDCIEGALRRLAEMYGVNLQ